MDCPECGYWYVLFINNRLGLDQSNERQYLLLAWDLSIGIREGAINSMDASSRKRLNYAQLLKLPETQILLVPDKAVQFK